MSDTSRRYLNGLLNSRSIPGRGALSGPDLSAIEQALSAQSDVDLCATAAEFAEIENEDSDDPADLDDLDIDAAAGAAPLDEIQGELRRARERERKRRQRARRVARGTVEVTLRIADEDRDWFQAKARDSRRGISPHHTT